MNDNINKVSRRIINEQEFKAKVIDQKIAYNNKKFEAWIDVRVPKFILK